MLCITAETTRVYPGCMCKKPKPRKERKAEREKERADRKGGEESLRVSRRAGSVFRRWLWAGRLEGGARWRRWFRRLCTVCNVGTGSTACRRGARTNCARASNVMETERETETRRKGRKQKGKGKGKEREGKGKENAERREREQAATQQSRVARVPGGFAAASSSSMSSGSGGAALGGHRLHDSESCVSDWLSWRSANRRRSSSRGSMAVSSLPCVTTRNKQHGYALARPTQYNANVNACLCIHQVLQTLFGKLTLVNLRERGAYFSARPW
jgi:hypothetical protein